MRTIADSPWVVLAAAIAVAGAVVEAATHGLFGLAAAIGGYAPAWQEAIVATVIYGLLALTAWVGRTLAGVTGERDRLALPLASAIGAAIGVGGFAVALGEAGLAGAVRPGAAGMPAMLVLGTAVTIGQSAAEELFFRGWVQRVLARHWSPIAAVGVTALIFAALHLAGGARGPLALANLMLGGVLFGLLAWRSGGLALPIAAHAGWNWAEGILFGLDPNPGVGSFGAWRDLDLVGPAMWGGSDEGLNASLAMTLVLAALILPVAAWATRPPLSPARAPG